MQRILTAALIWIALALPAAAQSREIEGVISGQIERFKADDFAGAFMFASPMIQGLFGTPDNFGMMVQRGYPMVHRPRDLRFLDLQEAPGGYSQIVEVEDMQGRRFLLRYDMIETGNGWKINGVSILPAPDVAT